jgi:hypothetical protein
MKCAVEMGTGAMIYIPSFIKMSSFIQTLLVVDAYCYMLVTVDMGFRLVKNVTVF